MVYTTAGFVCLRTALGGTEKEGGTKGQSGQFGTVDVIEVVRSNYGNTKTTWPV